MSDDSQLRGGCSCGRNQYVIHPPITGDGSLQVLLEEKADQGRFLSLRVPLSRLRSTTYAFYPDETHNAIRRAFTPRNYPHSKHYFCGFCGTQLTYWTEESREEADWVCVSLGSLGRESIEKLEEVGLFANVEENEKEEGNEEGNSKDNYEEKRMTKRKHIRELSGTPWFEEMIEGSELGKLKRRRGWRSSLDGKTQVEWEIVEYAAEDEENASVGGGKRKIEVPGDDAEMSISG